MNRRTFLTTASSLLAARSGRSQTRNERPPNLVFLLTDDQRWDALGCTGNPIVQTPNIDG